MVTCHDISILNYIRLHQMHTLSKMVNQQTIGFPLLDSIENIQESSLVCSPSLVFNLAYQEF
uniref:Uncharacterized protein n=1 Tax=Rhizophora mucronata TaxID=61149 RepID=A0A2P2PPV0_RHIMU